MTAYRLLLPAIPVIVITAVVSGQTPVTFDRILRANQEPQNWLTYSGDYNGRRHSLLKQINPSNARELTLKWVYQSRSLDKNETTPLKYRKH